jgi:formylglycine-generating enzyme required for sulfatase activity
MGGATTGLPFFAVLEMNSSICIGSLHLAAIPSRRVLTLLALVAVIWIAHTKAAAKTNTVWVRLELVENTADGSAFNRCEVEGTLKAHDALSSRIFYGEAKAVAGGGWEPVRPQSGCGLVTSDRAAKPWTVRGSPYLIVNITLQPDVASENEIQLRASLTTRKLSTFTADGKPAYEERSESRTLQVHSGSSVVIPILVASPSETEAFGVRELLLKFRVADFRPRVDYGEVAVTADVPRARVFLDGGFVGRTSSEGPFVLAAVRTGEREIVIRDPSGREARTLVRVEKGSRATASLTLLPKSPTGPSVGLRSLGRNAQRGEEFWREKDGALVVHIPGGEFRMGSAEGEGEQNEHPQHTVRVHGFLMDKTEVTWGQYKRFLVATSQPPPKSPVWGMPEALPVSSVTWDQAAAFCEWAGGRLPTEAEWERAARGDDARQYPWGNTFDSWRCNTRDGGPHAPTPAAQYQDCISPYGVLDLSGSVSEWCSDWYADDYAKSPGENPIGPETGTKRVSRGGGWMTPSQLTRVVSRAGIEPAWAGPMQGFRCAQDDKKEDEK